MDVKQLRTFKHVANLGSLTRASERLHIAQPALGRHIKMLEEELEVELFFRHGRGMVLTPAGQILLDRAETILDLVEQTRAEISSQEHAANRVVTLGVPPSVGEFIAGPLTEKLVESHPSIRVRIVPAFSVHLQEMLQRGEIDMAIMYEMQFAPQLRPLPLIQEPLFLVGPLNSDIDPELAIPFSELASLAMILPGSQHCLRTIIESEARRQDVVLNVIFEADSSHMQKDLVRRGLGYTILPFTLVSNEIDRNRLKYTPIRAPELSRGLVLACSDRRSETAAARLFGKFLKAHVADLVSSGQWHGRLLLDDEEREEIVPVTKAS